VSLVQSDSPGLKFRNTLRHGRDVLRRHKGLELGRVEIQSHDQSLFPDPLLSHKIDSRVPNYMTNPTASGRAVDWLLRTVWFSWRRGGISVIRVPRWPDCLPVGVQPQFTSGFLQPVHGTVSIPPREPKSFANLVVPSLDYIFAHYHPPVKPNEK